MTIDDIPTSLIVLSLALAIVLIALCLYLWYIILSKVAYTSQNVKNAKKIREEFSFCRIIHPKRVIYCKASSYSNFKHMQYRNVIKKHIQGNIDNLRLDLASADSNRQLYDKYLIELRDAYSRTPSFVINESGIPEMLYTAAEKRLLKQDLIPKSVYDITVKVIISYNTPKRKKYRSKQQVFTYDSIIGEYHKWEKQQKLSAKISKERARITPNLRYNIFARDGYKCCLCGLSAMDGAVLEVDHVIPLSKGGLTTPENLQTLCHDCNAGKSDKFPDQYQLDKLKSSRAQ